MKIAVNYNRINYYNFGFIPTGSFKHDLYSKMFGWKNLIKRLQMRDLIWAIDAKPTDYVVDLGCGGRGYVAFELAKISRKAFGLDIDSGLRTVIIPEKLKGKLQYIQADGLNLPFDYSCMDTVLASEVLPMISTPELMLKEIHRVLKDDGKLVILNGAGHPVIEKAFDKKSFLFRRLQRRYSDKMPNSYSDYCEALQKSFGTARRSFISEQEIRTMLEDNGFFLRSLKYTPGYMAGAFMSWTQFENYLRRGQTLLQKGFVLKYHFFNLLRKLERRTYPGGILCVAHKTG